MQRVIQWRWPTARDILMIAGNDPYAWKGVEDLAKPLATPRR
ncbi:MAG: hypothetical protein R2867_11655 [Caldilineaceae bacterium]